MAIIAQVPLAEVGSVIASKLARYLATLKERTVTHVTTATASIAVMVLEHSKLSVRKLVSNY